MSNPTVFHGNANQLVRSIEDDLDVSRQSLEEAENELRGLLDSAETEGRNSLSPIEDRRAEFLYGDIRRMRSAVRRQESRLARAQEVADDENRLEQRLQTITPTNAGNRARPAYDRVARVGREARTYNRESDPVGKNFLADVARHYALGDVQASDRLARHMREESVERPQYMTRAAGDETTSSFTGLTVPQYLVDMVAPATASLRPFADAATTKHTLPADGMSVNISRVTTPTAAGLQATQLTTVTTQSASDTLLSIPVQTAAGFVNVSRQAIDRGTGIDQTLLQDLFNRYASDLDNQLLNQATTGAYAVAQNIDVPAASFTANVLYSKILGGCSGVASALLNMGQATHVCMHPRRWYWLSAQSTSAWPLVSQSGAGPGGAMATQTSTLDRGVVGVLPNGVKVVADFNTPTNLVADAGSNEDGLIVVSQSECHLWEDPSQPAYIRAEQPNATSLGVLLVVYGYYAYTFSRYANAVQKLTGNALVAPTF